MRIMLDTNLLVSMFLFPTLPVAALLGLEHIGGNAELGF
jgi:predicted nucleic acid-binding protein